MEQLPEHITHPETPGDVCEIAHESAERVLCWSFSADEGTERFVKTGELCVMLEGSVSDAEREHHKYLFDDGSVGVKSYCVIHHVRTGLRLYTRRSNLRKLDS